MAFHVLFSCACALRLFTLLALLLLQVAGGRPPRLEASDNEIDELQAKKMGSSYANSFYDPSKGGQKVWCIGKPAAEDTYLRKNIDYACGQEGVDCRLIQQGGSCFSPNTPIAHASFAMNLYYQQHGRNWWNCHFNNTGIVVFTDPSFGNCQYTADWGI